MRPTLACLLAAASPLARSADIRWDGGAGSANWNAPANWSTDTLPTGNDIAWFDLTASCPTTVLLDTSYPDTGQPLNLVLNAGHNLTIEAATGRELYLNSVRVLDTATYTLHVPRNGLQAASGTMPASGSLWDVALGGTLIVRDDLGSKALAAGSWAKTGAGTLRLGDGVSGTFATPLLQLRALAGLTELNYIIGNSTNGITEIAAGATVRALCYNPYTTVLPYGPGAYGAGVTGVAGTFDLNGFEQYFRALSGSSSGRITGNSGRDTVNLTLGLGAYAPGFAEEGDGDFAGSIQDGTSGHLRLIIHGTREGYTQVLSGQSTFTGGTVVRGGRLVLAHATDTLPAGGALTVDGGTVDLGDHAQAVGALTLRSGAVSGVGGRLRAESLDADISGTFELGVRLFVDGPMVKRGIGTLVLGNDLGIGMRFGIESGQVVANGHTLAGVVDLRGASLVGGDYDGTIVAQGDCVLSGRILAGGQLTSDRAVIQAENLVIDGVLRASDTRLTGGIVEVNGIQQIADSFHGMVFAGGVTYGAESMLEWIIGPSQLAYYVDGTTEGERGQVFGAMDIGGAGLTIAEGARIRTEVYKFWDDTFWLTPRLFKVGSMLDGASITGAFLIDPLSSFGAGSWSTYTEGDGLYLAWAGMPMPAAVPEPGMLRAAAGIGLFAAAWRARRRQRQA